MVSVNIMGTEILSFMTTWPILSLTQVERKHRKRPKNSTQNMGKRSTQNSKGELLGLSKHY